VVAEGATLPPHEYHCPLLSLPLAFRTELASIPSAVPYLRADPARQQAWRQALGPRTGRRVGIAFSGSPDHPEDGLRSIPAALLLPALALPGLELHVAQKDIRPADAEALPAAPWVRCHADRLTDFAETAALLSQLDLVVTVDTSLAHLAGAMGLPVWLLLQASADFRWLRGRDDSPWYPTARLFRQPAAGRWEPVLARVAEEARRWAETE
jgi:hypothetical protein